MILGYSTPSKNLTGERKAVFSTIDVTQVLNIDDNACLITNGNIVSSASIIGRHASFTDLYIFNLSCMNASFLYTEFDEYYA